MTRHDAVDRREEAWRNRLGLARLLRAGIEAGAPMPEIGDWPAVIALAAEEQLTPTLAALPCWPAHRAAMPEPVRDYFEAALFLNAERERAMAATLARAMTALAPVEPVALKGAAHLIAGLYPAPGARLMGDLDILVADTARAAALLAEAGFDPPDTSRRAWVRLRHHHSPMQRDPATGAGVELHDAIATVGDPAILAPEAVRRRAETRFFAGRDMRIPAPTDRLIHAILHDQVSDRGALVGRIGMRLLLEIALIVHAEKIDWTAARAAFPSQRWRRGFDRVIALTGAWLGAPVPAGDAQAAEAWLRRGRSRAGKAAAVAAQRAAGLLRTQPLSLANLLDPKWAAARLRDLLADR